MKPVPSRLEPILVPRLWGTRSLAPLFPEKTALPEPIGEAWLTGHECRFVEGPLAGRTLGEAWQEMPAEWRGRQARANADFPLLVKFIFPKDKLSIQVHPHDDYARQHEAAAGGAGKTEMWYVVAARAGAELLVGLKPDVTVDSFGRAIVEGTTEDYLERIAVRPGDAIFVPAGTVHTIGPGLVLCEIQEYSDITYRIFDYNRLTPQGIPRPLHIEKALEVINFGEQSSGKLEPIWLAHGPVTETYLIACRYFAVEKWDFAERIAAVTSPEHFDLVIFLEGRGRIVSRDSSVDYASPQVWLLPACLGAYQLSPRVPSTLLRAYVPDIVNDFVRRLADQGVKESAWSRLVYP